MRSRSDWKPLLLVIAAVVGFVVFVSARYPSMIERRQAANQTWKESQQVKQERGPSITITLPNGTQLDSAPFLKATP
ncbi:hypothetical protein EGJ86_21110 [Pseudomonas sp. o96-267]|nr:hypothetical protein EGJ86_21110 [Pseudomonas sp. o96-267]